MKDLNPAHAKLYCLRYVDKANLLSGDKKGQSWYNTRRNQRIGKGLSTRKAGRGHATPHMPVETAKCWWLEPNAWAGGKGSCAVCVDLQAVGALEFFGESYNGFGPIFEGVWAGFREREGSIFSNHQHFAVSTGICGVACPLPASGVDKPVGND